MHPKDFKEFWHLRPGELAELLGAQPATVSRWLSGEQQPDRAIVLATQMIHACWLDLDLKRQQLPPHQMELYEIASDRRARVSQQSTPE